MGRGSVPGVRPFSSKGKIVVSLSQEVRWVQKVVSNTAALCMLGTVLTSRQMKTDSFCNVSRRAVPRFNFT